MTGLSRLRSWFVLPRPVRNARARQVPATRSIAGELDSRRDSLRFLLACFHLLVEALPAQLIQMWRGLRAWAVIDQRDELLRRASLIRTGFPHLFLLCKMGFADLIQALEVGTSDGWQGSAESYSTD